MDQMIDLGCCISTSVKKSSFREMEKSYNHKQEVKKGNCKQTSLSKSLRGSKR
jgi:hypothetical protein